MVSPYEIGLLTSGISTKGKLRIALKRTKSSSLNDFPQNLDFECGTADDFHMIGKFSKKRRFQAGFSVLEIIVVLGILAIATMIAYPIIQQFLARAKQTEPPLQLRTLASLVAAHDADSELLHGSGILTINDFTTKRSCLANNGQNPFGFALTDCKRINFNYGFVRAKGQPSQVYAVEAVESECATCQGTGRVFPKCLGADVWRADPNFITHVTNPIEPSDCDSCFRALFTASEGEKNSKFDFDGDGIVDPAGHDSSPIQTSKVGGHWGGDWDCH